MKSFLTILFLFCFSTLFAQTEGKYSVGLGVTPSIAGTTFGVYVNRHIGKKLQVGLIPFGRFRNHTNTSNKIIDYSYGLNINTRYTFINSKIFNPYGYAFTGIGHSNNKTEWNNTVSSFKYSFINYSIGAGSLINIGSKGWSVDVNAGYIWIKGIDSYSKYSTERTLIYSVGIFKRF